MGVQKNSLVYLNRLDAAGSVSQPYSKQDWTSGISLLGIIFCHSKVLEVADFQKVEL